jgi:hypothetical protein
MGLDDRWRAVTGNAQEVRGKFQQQNLTVNYQAYEWKSC